MRIRYLFIIISFLILLSCSDQDITEENDPIPDEEVNEIALRAPDILLSQNNFTTGDNLPMTVDKYCWEGIEEECNLTPTDSQEYLSESLYLTVNEDDNIIFTISHSGGPSGTDAFFDPEELTIIQTTASTGNQQEIEVNDMQFNPIKEEGLIYYYTIIAKWDDEEVTGEAIYGARLHVRD